jgi:hypothetical protein
MQKMDRDINNLERYIEEAFGERMIQSTKQEDPGATQRAFDGQTLTFTLFPKFAVELQVRS